MKNPILFICVRPFNDNATIKLICNIRLKKVALPLKGPTKIKTYKVLDL